MADAPAVWAVVKTKLSSRNNTIKVFFFAENENDEVAPRIFNLGLGGGRGWWWDLQASAGGVNWRESGDICEIIFFLTYFLLGFTVPEYLGRELRV